jgi:transcriptional regulator with XRE-family HTH domain
MLKLFNRKPVRLRSDYSLEELADALGVSPQRLKQVAADLASLARSGQTIEQFARELHEGYRGTTVSASEAFAVVSSYRT